MGAFALAYFLAQAFFLYWLSPHYSGITGDEPHYLVMTSGIAESGTLEQTIPYRDEFRTRAIYEGGLAPQDAEPNSKNTSAVKGPRGLFNIHNIGLPLLLVVPFAIGGVSACKLFMILLAGLFIPTSWRIASLFTGSMSIRFGAVLATTIGLPFTIAATQVYPDLLAGLIVLNGFCWLWTLSAPRARSVELFYAASIAYLPWLQIKFTAAAFILVFAIGMVRYRQTRSWSQIAPFLAVFVLSLAALGAYNLYAFGNLTGPYDSRALVLNKTAYMVFAGLHFDQAHGFLLQNPVLLAGIPALGLLFARHWRFAMLWGVLYAALIVPNALHPAWYGGFSFVGRFGWTGAALALFPALLGITALGRHNPRLFWTVVIAGALLQAVFYFKLAKLDLNPYNTGPVPLLSAHGIFYFPFERWLPALYNESWAFGYAPNYCFLLLVLSLLAYGFLHGRGVRTNAKRLTGGAIIIGIGFVLARLIGGDLREPVSYQAYQLPSQTGALTETGYLAQEGKDKPGFLSFGPYVPLQPGRYKIIVRYASNSEYGEPVGYLDVFSIRAGVASRRGLMGTRGEEQSLSLPFHVADWSMPSFEFRIFWDGHADLRMRDIELQAE